MYHTVHEIYNPKSDESHCSIALSKAFESESAIV